MLLLLYLEYQWNGLLSVDDAIFEVLCGRFDSSLLRFRDKHSLLDVAEKRGAREWQA